MGVWVSAGMGLYELNERAADEFADCFFFRQKTAYELASRDWSSDVCSSDLVGDTRGTKYNQCTSPCESW